MCAYACVVLDRQGVLIRYAGIPASVLAATGALMTDDRSSRSDMQDPGSRMLPLRAQTSGGEPVLTLNTGVRLPASRHNLSGPGYARGGGVCV